MGAQRGGPPGGQLPAHPRSCLSCLPLPGLNRLLGQVLNGLSKAKLFSLHPKKGCVRTVKSHTLRPYRLQPTRFLCPWNCPGKSTGVGCHCLLQLYRYPGAARSPRRGLGAAGLWWPSPPPPRSTECHPTLPAGPVPGERGPAPLTAPLSGPGLVSGPQSGSLRTHGTPGPLDLGTEQGCSWWRPLRICFWY